MRSFHTCPVEAYSRRLEARQAGRQGGRCAQARAAALAAARAGARDATTELGTHRLGAAILGHAGALAQRADLQGSGRRGMRGGLHGRARCAGPDAAGGTSWQAGSQNSHWQAGRTWNTTYGSCLPVESNRQRGGGSVAGGTGGEAPCSEAGGGGLPAPASRRTLLTKGLRVPQAHTLQQIDFQAARLPRHPAAPASESAAAGRAASPPAVTAGSAP